MVVEGEGVQASLAVDGGAAGGRITAVKTDGATVMSGTVSVGPDHPETELKRAARDSAHPRRCSSSTN